MIKESPLTIGLLWHSVNSDNLGIGALTASHIAIVEKIAHDLGIKVRFKVIGWRDPAPAYINQPNVDVVPLRTRNLILPGKLFAAIRGCDFVLDISAGDSFADIYGVRRFIVNAASKAIVLAARRPFILSPQTIGPFRRRWTSSIAKGLLRAAHKVATRDSLSSEFLGPMKLGERLLETTDVAFRLPYDAPSPRSASPIRFGLNVSGLLFNGGYTRDNMFSLAADYPALVRSILTHFTKTPQLEVHLIGHVNSRGHEVEDDYRVAERLANEFPDVIVAPWFESPSHAKSYIATMDFFCGSRMHACIAAFSSGVPVLPIAYSRKFAGLFNSLGYNHVADCRNQNSEEIMKMIVDAYERRIELKSLVEDGQDVAEKKLAVYEAVLRTCLGDAKFWRP